MKKLSITMTSHIQDVDALANFIRQIDGINRLGAGALAERICIWLAETTKSLAQPHPVQEPVKGWWAHTCPEDGKVDVVNCQLTPADKRAGWVEHEVYTSPQAQPQSVHEHAVWNKGIRDSVDSLLAQAGYQPDSSARHQLAMMNFDTPTNTAAE